MQGEYLRVISDIHYGEHSSRVTDLAQLEPLCRGPRAMVLNGDTLDTRPGPMPEIAGRLRCEADAFFGSLGFPVSFVTGNHDPDISGVHALELADGRVFATHGDVVFPNIVPWGRDAGMVTQMIREELARLPEDAAARLTDRLEAYRRVSARVSQRHQAERDPFKYLVRILFDTCWPPWRVGNIFVAWASHPGLLAELLRTHRSGARFILAGHTHRPCVRRFPDGVVVVNTGSFCRPLGAFAADLYERGMIVRRIARRSGQFHPGDQVAQFSW